METIFQKIAIGVVAFVTSIVSIFAPATGNNLGAVIPTPVALFQTSLATSIGPSDTSMSLVSATDADGNLLASSTYGFIIDEGTSLEEFVIGDCTGTSCTNLTRGVSVVTGTSTVTALKKAHRRGASVKITDAPLILVLARILNGQETLQNVLVYNSNLAIATSSNQIVHSNYLNANYLSLSGAQTANGAKIFTGAVTFSATSTFNRGALTDYPCLITSPNNQLCDKAYIDSVAVAGASDANQTTKGIVEEATTAEINAFASTGATGAKLFMTPAVFALSNVYTKSIAATSTSLIPNPDSPNTGTLGDVTLATSSTASAVGRVSIPFGITASKLTIRSNTFVAAGTTTIAFFTQDGQTRLFSQEILITADGNNTVTFPSPIDIRPGMYYVVAIPDARLKVNFKAFNTVEDGFATTTTALPKAEGQLTSFSVGVMPTSFNPTTEILYIPDRTLGVRLDN